METNNSNKSGVVTAHTQVHPSVFTLLILPVGIMGGYVTVTLAFLYAKEGVSVENIASLVASVLLPHIFKFIWAPLVDSTLSLKKWYLIANVGSAIGILTTGILPIEESSIHLLTLIVIISNFIVTFLSMATEGLMAHDVPEELKGRAAGFYQAGNLGGAGLGGGAGLWFAQRIPEEWMVGALLAFTSLLCCTGLYFLREPKSTIRDFHIINTYRNLLLDVWSTLKTRLGILAMIICFLTLGTGAAANLWSAVAKDWGASADTVALVTGLLNGILTAGGCLWGGWICDRVNRKNAYLVFGFLGALSVVGMAYSPKTEPMYIFWTSVYAVLMGFSYAGFSAIVLETIGKGAAVTKYNIYVMLTNIPVYLMIYIEGLAHSRWGPTGMLNIEAVFAILAIILFLFVQAAMKERKSVSLEILTVP